jgi:steroid delta-isomerase-like uncharacterized protein
MNDSKTQEVNAAIAILLLAERFAETLNTRNVDLFDTFVHPDYRNHNPFVAPGRDGVKQFFAGWLAAFPDTTVVVEDALVSDDHQKLVGRFTYEATHTGDFLGIPATGNRIAMRSIDIWRVENGQLTEHWDELNLLQVFQQLDVIPALG